MFRGAFKGVSVKLKRRLWGFTGFQDVSEAFQGFTERLGRV